MKASQRLMTAALFAIAGSSAFAYDVQPETWMSQTKMTKSVEQVKAELAQARKDGTINASSSGYNFIKPGTKTRAQVRAELAAARASGEYELLNTEVSTFYPVPRAATYAQRRP